MPRFKCVMSIDGRDTRPPRPPRPRRYFADTSARRFLTLANLVLPLLLLSGLYYAIPTLDTDRTLRSPRPHERAHDFPNVLHYPNDSSSSTLRFYNDSIRLLTNASTSHVSLSSALENSSCIRPIDVCPLHRYYIPPLEWGTRRGGERGGVPRARRLGPGRDSE